MTERSHKPFPKPEGTVSSLLDLLAASRIPPPMPSMAWLNCQPWAGGHCSEAYHLAGV